MKAVESQTPQGGKVVTYEGLGTVWLKLGARRRRQVTDAGVTRAVEVLAAVTRADERLEEGQVIRFGGADWALVGMVPEGVGRVTLNLERRR